ncbi:hypothetical protein DFA_02013 [Cavenderia fasciculata]|uniref:Transmembrane protein n=1 Tax=Cavenderia fasciculata TaxID=261658 RepID=F4PYG2_CACFS|nr:uncharacterized protein DFA_02013 [Cavenderia fasciculata]EGG19228.1 hypothetical protein DFA_02013 [Cavenderia fasciculata]|eukprot:XP_004357499.1 hypothetical protein DFA_02013 [Cavenderia fasciculata]
MDSKFLIFIVLFLFALLGMLQLTMAAPCCSACDVDDEACNDRCTPTC